MGIAAVKHNEKGDRYTKSTYCSRNCISSSRPHWANHSLEVLSMLSKKWLDNFDIELCSHLSPNLMSRISKRKMMRNTRDVL